VLVFTPSIERLSSSIDHSLELSMIKFFFAVYDAPNVRRQ
jgi:hypothetical protein